MSNTINRIATVCSRKSRCLFVVLPMLLIAAAGQARAADHNWDNSLVGGTYSWFTGTNWVGTVGGVPIDGNTVDQEVDNTQRTYDINNAGAGVNLPNSTIDIGRGVFLDSSAGGVPALANDGIVGNIIRFNGAGGQSPTINVPVTANTFSSNRHGAVFNREITVNTILANSGHQDHWKINVSPTGTIGYVDLDENRGADGGSIDGNFEFNANTTVTLLDHTWSNLRVGAGATLDVGTYNYWDYTNKASDNNINPVYLAGDLNAEFFNVFDVQSNNTTALADGTYGRIGHGSVDFEVDWITGFGNTPAGDGILTIGSQAIGIPEPSALILATLGLLSLGVTRRRRRR